MPQSLYTLGINAAYHDLSACLLKDGEVVGCVEEERFTRRKHAKEALVSNSDELPWRSIAHLLGREGASLADVTQIGYSLQPKNRLRNAEFGDAVIPGSWGSAEGERRFYELVSTVPEQLRNAGFGGSFHWLDHHSCHLASAFYPSGYSSAALLSVDGIGETASSVAAYGSDNEIRELRRIEYPNSLGFLWEKLCEFLGFSRYDACKVMSLAAYGDAARYRPEMRRLIAPDSVRGFVTDAERLSFRTDDFDGLEQLFGLPRRLPNAELAPAHYDVAAALQTATTEIMHSLALWLHEKTGSDSLAMVGGVLLNCVTNRHLVEETPFRNVFIQPAANDAGTALGAALLLWHGKDGRPRAGRMDHAYLGPSFPESAIEDELRRSRVNYERVSRIEQRIGELLATGCVVGWFQGAMEFGPRALGNRSLLADPRSTALARRLNDIVKHREFFRPFAPSVLSEEAERWFEIKRRTPASDYMLVAYPVRNEYRARIPGVLHVDGSARIQTVRKETNPKYHGVIDAFYRQTGVPLVLNTSFNDREPIVCSPMDALRTFEATDIDYLAIGPFLVSRN